MYVYDQAHVLAKALRESPEYKVLKKHKEKIESEEQTKKMFYDYRMKQFEIQKLQLTGQAVPDEKMQAFRQVHDIVIANPVFRQFLEAENKFGIIMGDIQKILVEGLELG